MRTSLPIQVLVEPQPRQRRAGARRAPPSCRRASCGRILGTEAGHCKAIPGGDTDLAAERHPTASRMPLDQRLVAGHDQRRADGHARHCRSPVAPVSRRYRHRAARFRRTPACHRDAGASGRRTRPVCIRSPMAARPNTTISQSRSEARIGQIDIDAPDGCGPGRTGWSPAAARTDARRPRPSARC